MAVVVQHQQPQGASQPGVSSSEVACRSGPSAAAVCAAAAALAGLLGALKKSGGLRRFVLRMGVGRAAASSTVAALIVYRAMSRRRRPPLSIAAMDGSSSGDVVASSAKAKPADIAEVGAEGAAKNNSLVASGPQQTDAHPQAPATQASVALPPAALMKPSDTAGQSDEGSQAASEGSNQDLIPPWCSGKARDSRPSFVNSEAAASAPLVSGSSSPKSDASTSASSGRGATIGIPAWCSGAKQLDNSHRSRVRSESATSAPLTSTASSPKSDASNYAVSARRATIGVPNWCSGIPPVAAAAPPMARPELDVTIFFESQDEVAAAAVAVRSVQSADTTPDWCRGSSTIAQPSIKKVAAAPQPQQTDRDAGGGLPSMLMPNPAATPRKPSLIPDWCAGQSSKSCDSTAANGTTPNLTKTQSDVVQVLAERKSSNKSSRSSLVGAGHRPSGAAEIPSWCAAKA